MSGIDPKQTSTKRWRRTRSSSTDPLSRMAAPQTGTSCPLPSPTAPRLPQTLLGVGPCFRVPPVDLGYIEAAHERVTDFHPSLGDRAEYSES